MDLINRYVYDVTRRLPERQRGEIEKEVRGLVADMLVERYGDRDASKAELEAVLMELGSPATLADNYRGGKRYLIGPDYFDRYMSVLKIVTGAVFLGISVALAVSYAVNPPESLITAFTRYFGSIFSALLQVFAWVTGGFAIAEYNREDAGKAATQETWSVAKLPELPGRAAVIKPIDPLINIGFNVVFIAILNFAPELFGSMSISDGQLSNLVPLFSLDILRKTLPVINVLFALSILKEVGKLYTGRWTMGLALGNIVLNASVLVLVALVFHPGAAIWNPDMMPVLQDIIPRFFVFAYGLGLVVDSIVSYFKAIKGTKNV